MKFSKTIWLIVLLMVLPSIGHAQGVKKPNRLDKSKFQKLFEKEKQESINKLQSAANNTSLPKDKRVENAIQAGKLLTDMAKRTNDKKQLESAIKQYSLASDLASGKEKTQALNNLGTIYLLQNQPAEALKQFEKIELRNVPDEQQFAVLYNKGRSLEKLGNNAQAVRAFIQAFDKNPQFLRIIPRVLAMVMDDRELTNEGYRLADAVVEQGQARSLLEACQKLSPQSDKQLDMLCYCYALSYSKLRITPEEFVKDELGKFRDSVKHERCARELGRAYQEDLTESEIPTTRVATEQKFPWWTDSSRDKRVPKAFSRLLRNIGDYYSQTGLYAGGQISDEQLMERHRDAVARFKMAWTIDSDYFESAESIAVALSRQNDPELTDPALIEAMTKENKLNIVRKFDAKSLMIDDVRKNRTIENMDRLMRMHILLGMVFEKQEKYGNSADPKSAVFQFERALQLEEALEKIREAEGLKQVVSEQLHRKLGNAYQKTGRGSQARMHLRIAEEAKK